MCNFTLFYMVFDVDLFCIVIAVNRARLRINHFVLGRKIVKVIKVEGAEALTRRSSRSFKSCVN